jgi:hypothetical protein
MEVFHKFNAGTWAKLQKIHNYAYGLTLELAGGKWSVSCSGQFQPCGKDLPICSDALYLV